MGLRLLAITTTMLTGAIFAAQPALAQKHGGTLKYYHRDNPPTTSIHEEATISTVNPFMAVFNNLVLFDQSKPREGLDTIVPDLAESWSWSEDGKRITFKLRQGVKWHDGQPFTSKDVGCTFDLLLGKAKDGLRLNPRQVWYQNVENVRLDGDFEVTLELKEPQPSLLAMLASGYSPIYPCHVSPREMRTKPIGTGPFRFVEFRRSEVIRLARNPDYWKSGRPYLDAIEVRIIPSRSTRILAFVAGEFDMTYDIDVTIPLMKDVQSQAPTAVCQLRPTGIYSNLLVNRDAAPFDDPKLRRAMALAIDRKSFDDILGQGKLGLSGAMQPLPEGFWGMPADVLKSLPGYSNDMQGRLAEAQAIMRELGYGPDKPLRVKVSTRDIGDYRDPAVILIDHLKKIYVEGELEVVDTTLWHRKVTRGDYSVGMNLTGIGWTIPTSISAKTTLAIPRETTTITATPRSTILSPPNPESLISTSENRWSGRSSANLRKMPLAPSFTSCAQPIAGTPTSRGSCCIRTASTTMRDMKTSGSTSDGELPDPPIAAHGSHAVRHFGNHLRSVAHRSRQHRRYPVRCRRDGQRGGEAQA
jgi:peptide/nickel transport system substrate-binding protein